MTDSSPKLQGLHKLMCYKTNHAIGFMIIANSSYTDTVNKIKDNQKLSERRK